MSNVSRLASAWVACACFVVALGSCGGSDNDAVDAKTNRRVKAASVTPPTTFFPNVPIPSDANIRGMWSPVYNWPGISVHLVVLPDGRVLNFGSNTTGRQGAFSS